MGQQAQPEQTVLMAQQDPQVQQVILVPQAVQQAPLELQAQLVQLVIQDRLAPQVQNQP
jgi:hypothetical protein